MKIAPRDHNPVDLISIVSYPPLDVIQQFLVSKRSEAIVNDEKDCGRIFANLYSALFSCARADLTTLLIGPCIIVA